MGQIGTAEIYTQSNGWLEIDLYDPADFNFAPVEIRTANGWGVPYLHDPSAADTPIEVYTQSNGWQGVSTTGYLVIDSFEDADLDEWVESESTGIDVTSGRSAFQGDYGLLLDADTCNRIASAPTFSPSLSDYPSPGGVYDSFVRFDDADSFNNDLWWKFGCQQYPTEDGFGSKDLTDGYVFEIDPPSDQLALRRDEDTYGDGQTDTNTDLDRVSFAPVLDQWYRLEIDWHHSTSSQIIITVYEVTKTDWEGTQVAQASASDTTFGEGAIECAAEDGVHWDLLRRTAPL